MSAKEKQTADYINKKLNPILSNLTIDILHYQPEDVVDFIISWLLSNAGKNNIRKFKSDGHKTKTIQDLVGSCIELHKPEPEKSSEFTINPIKESTESEHHTEQESEDDEDDEVEELPKFTQKSMKQRNSVSAEPFRGFNAKFKARVIPKSAEQEKRIRSRIYSNILFEALEDNEKNILIGAMEERDYQAGDWVIRQGEDGDELFFVEQGELDCSKTFKKEEGDKYLKTYKPGESFGELALLYNVPRAASIRAKTDSKLFVLDRDCFNNIIRNAAIKKRTRYEDFLQKVPILQEMDSYERTQLCDIVKSQKFKNGDYIIRQGDIGDCFYIIEEGSAIATKILPGNTEATKVFEYKVGDYFGELALLKDTPRAANIVATSDVTVVIIQRDEFMRILGPLKEILRRNMSRYTQYSDKM